MISYALDTNHKDVRYTRWRLAHYFATHDPKLRTVPEERYPEAHVTLRRILSGQRVSDFDLEWAAGVAEGIRRTSRWSAARKDAK